MLGYRERLHESDEKDDFWEEMDRKGLQVWEEDADDPDEKWEQFKIKLDHELLKMLGVTWDDLPDIVDVYSRFRLGDEPVQVARNFMRALKKGL